MPQKASLPLKMLLSLNSSSLLKSPHLWSSSKKSSHIFLAGSSDGTQGRSISGYIVSWYFFRFLLSFFCPEFFFLKPSYNNLFNSFHWLSLKHSNLFNLNFWRGGIRCPFPFPYDAKIYIDNILFWWYNFIKINNIGG